MRSVETTGQRELVAVRLHEVASEGRASRDSRLDTEFIVALPAGEPVREPAIGAKALVVGPDVGAVARLVLRLRGVVEGGLQADEVLPRAVGKVRRRAQRGYVARFFGIETQGERAVEPFPERLFRIDGNHAHDLRRVE